MTKKTIWIICFIVFIVVCVVLYKAIDLWIYRGGFQDVYLKQVAHQNIDMSKNQKPYWVSITTQPQSEFFKKRYRLELPDIDFKTEMFILSFGSELESLKYNVRDKRFLTRKKYLAFPHFQREDSINIVYIYVAETVPLMDTDEAGFPPDYKGR